MKDTVNRGRIKAVVRNHDQSRCILRAACKKGRIIQRGDNKLLVYAFLPTFLLDDCVDLITFVQDLCDAGQADGTKEP